MAKAHWEAVTVPPCAAMADAYARGFPASLAPAKAPMIFTSDRKDYNQLSPNHHATGVAARLCWAAAYGSAKDYENARIPQLHVLDLELELIGLMQSEQYTGIVHGGFYLLAAFVARMAASKKKDTELLAREDEHFKRWFQYLALASTPGGDIVMCGERMKVGPTAPQQAAIWREAKGIPHPEKRKIEGQIGDDFWASLRAFRALRVAGDDLGGAIHLKPEDCPALPFTAQPVELVRWKGGHAARYVGNGGDGTCTWVEVRGEKVSWGVERNHPLPSGGVVIKTQKRVRSGGK